MLTKLEIIDKCVNTILSQGRAVNEEGSCVYRTKDGRGCAVGMFIPDEMYSEVIENAMVCSLVNEDTKEELGVEKFDDFLIEECKGHEREFWEDLQSFHDTRRYWYGKGDQTRLSGPGKEALSKLRDCYGP